MRDTDIDSASRDGRQSRVYSWVGRTFGIPSLETTERCKRFVEEAIELAQAAGLSESQVRSIVAYVYKKPPGEVRQEVGGVGTTLLAFCASLGISADDEEEEEAELQRVLKVDPEHFRRRHNVKADAGIAERVVADDRRDPTDGEFAAGMEKALRAAPVVDDFRRGWDAAMNQANERIQWMVSSRRSALELAAHAHHLAKSIVEWTAPTADLLRLDRELEPVLKAEDA